MRVCVAGGKQRTAPRTQQPTPAPADLALLTSATSSPTTLASIPPQHRNLLQAPQITGLALTSPTGAGATGAAVIKPVNPGDV